MIEPRILEVRTKILKKNDELAREMRDEFVGGGRVGFEPCFQSGDRQNTLAAGRR